MDNTLGKIESETLGACLSLYGISSKHIGRMYIWDAVALGYKQTPLLKSFKMQIYPAIAKLHDSSPDSIEKSIRNAIIKSDCYSKLNFITNKEFVIGLIEKIKMACAE